MCDRQLRYLNQFLLRPNLDGLNLLGGLGLDAIGVQKDLQSREGKTEGEGGREGEGSVGGVERVYSVQYI